MADQDLESEQRWLDKALADLERMVERADRARRATDRSVAQENTVDARIAQAHMAKRQADLVVSSGPLCFGRIDTDSAERYYIGRRHVEDESGDEVVVDWRAPVASPFYRSTSVDPCGLDHRRRFVCEENRIIAIMDEDLTDPDGESSGGLPDPLLAELGRSRGSAMSDIVATIAAEQDEIIRSGLEELLIVQGGPGTGKTAVGLHRAAYLLFTHRDYLHDSRVLVVGPNPVFLRYISDVLPSLGETSVSQTTLAGLQAARYPVRSVDEDSVVALKGDERMAQLIERAVARKLRVAEDGLEVHSGLAIVRFDRAEVATLMDRAAGRAIPANSARDSFRSLLMGEAWKKHSQRSGVDSSEQEQFMRGLRTSKAFDKSISWMWPNLSAPVLIRELLGSRPVLRECAEGLLDASEVESLFRQRASKISDEEWSEADLPLLDEAAAAISGVPARYGHVVIDEAQDVSPMGLRMLSRRAIKGSMTVLGDLAQATAPASATSWDEVAQHLTSTGAANVRVCELTVGYRVPAAALDVANRLLEVAAPTVTPARSVRLGGSEPQLLSVEPEKVVVEALRVTANLPSSSSRAIIAAPETIDLIEEAAKESDLELVRVGRNTLPGRGATALLEPDQAKGLEFDEVVVVEPADIADLEHGLRRLYVSLTRCVSGLYVVSSRHWLV